MAVYIVFMLLGVLLTLVAGSVGYFICFLKNEKKTEKFKKSTEKYNAWNGFMRYW